MPWDMFCPNCSATLVGDMVDGEQEMKDSQAEYKDNIIYCSYCNIYIDFNSGEVIDLISHLHCLFNEKKTGEGWLGIIKVRIINGG